MYRQVYLSKSLCSKCITQILSLSLSQRGSDKVPLVLVGDKSYTEIYGSLKREVSWEEGEQMADSIGTPFFEVNTRTKQNVEEVLCPCNECCACVSQTYINVCTY